jgi:riboflavin-specific deaminase-like protein
VDAVVVGVETILRDDPSLTVRLVKGPDPIKIILDSHLRTPLKAKVLSTGQSIIATVRGADAHRLQRYRQRGAEVWQLPPDERGRVPLAGLLRRAGEKGLASILVEGGQQVFTSAIREKVVDRLAVFIAPCLLGRGKASLGDLGVEKMAQALAVREVSVRHVGPDLLMIGRL